MLPVTIALAVLALAAAGYLARTLRRTRRVAAAHAAELQRCLTRLELDRADLERTAVTDPLTGVWNYRYLQLTLTREVAGSLRHDRPCAVLLISLDGFAALKRAHGRPHANALLRDYAQRLSLEIRRTDTLGRYSGEEFVVVLPETGAEGAAHVAERLRWTVRRHRPLLNAEVQSPRITASVGIAVLPEDGRHAATLLRAADRSLVAAREQEAPGAGAA